MFCNKLYIKVNFWLCDGLYLLGRSVMYIQPNYNNISMTGVPSASGSKSSFSRFKDRIKQSIIDAIPGSTFKDNSRIVDRWKKFDERMSRPAENRLIMGVTALATQPAIDYYNPRVNKDTRTVSRNRTIAKIVAGTGVGILVRGSCYKLIENMTDIGGKSKFSKSLIPKKYISEIAENSTFLKNHRNALSMGVAILAMCFTNFLLDAPLTVFLTNRLNDKTKKAVHNE